MINQHFYSFFQSFGTDPFGADPFNPGKKSPTPALPPKQKKPPPPRPPAPKDGRLSPNPAAGKFAKNKAPDPFGGSDPFGGGGTTLNSNDPFGGGFADFGSKVSKFLHL